MFFARREDGKSDLGAFSLHPFINCAAEGISCAVAVVPRMPIATINEIIAAKMMRSEKFDSMRDVSRAA